MAAARMGLKTALYTLNVDLIAQMSCNPAVGGIAKGHLVREVDALGGIMGEITDAVGIQFRLLNTSRGPAVWSPRAQCDKQAYRLKMREVLESQPNLKIKQAEVADLIVEARAFELSSFQLSSESSTAQVDCRRRLIRREARNLKPAKPSPRDSPARRPHGRRVGRRHHHRNISQRPDSLRRAAISRRTFGRAQRRSAGRGFEEARPARMPASDTLCRVPTRFQVGLARRPTARGHVAPVARRPRSRVGARGLRRRRPPAGAARPRAGPG